MNTTLIRRPALFLLLLALVSCSGGGKNTTTNPDPPQATSISISQSAFTLTFVGQSRSLTATVRDQFQATFPSTITWTSGDPSVATVSSAGLVTAVADGVATITATAGSLSASATATVERVATRVVKISGDQQAGTVGEALPEPAVIEVADAGGTAMAGVGVTFTSGSTASVDVTEATTDEQGRASATWTLGTTAGFEILSAVVTGSTTAKAQFTATALPGPKAGIDITAGDQQVVPVGFEAFEPVAVVVTDEYGNGVPGVSVAFAVTGGGGSVTPDQGTTDEDGTAQATWTMGGLEGANTLSATVSDLPAVEFMATAAAPKPDLQPGPVAISPGNPTSLQAVEVSSVVTNVGFLPVAAGVQAQLLLDGVDAGTVALPSLAIGTASRVTFNLGPLAPGARTLRIVIDPGGALDEWDEANNAAERSADIPTSTLLTAGASVAGLSAPDSVEILFTLEVPPTEPGTIEVTLSGGSGDPDLYVHYGDRPADRDDYQCQSGNPNTNERCIINAAQPGTYHILIFAWTAFTDISILATTGGPVVPYDIELVFINNGTAEQNGIFAEAATRWMQILPGDISDFDFSVSPADADSCIEGQPALTGIIDDLRIYVSIEEIDGVGGTLASAGPCFIRGLGQYPIVGSMRFDSEDLDRLTANGELLPVVMHEMGHVIGIGTLWGVKALLQNPSLPSSAGVDTYFTGTRTRNAFEDAGGGTVYTQGNIVPVENSARQGSADSHWRESVLDSELMTPSFNSGRVNPLSAITIESLADIGYTVDVSRAEPYTQVYSVPGQAAPAGRIIDLGGDIRQGPIYVMDTKGRVRAVVQGGTPSLPRIR